MRTSLRCRVLYALAALSLTAAPARAVVQGSEVADVAAHQLESSGDYVRAAEWRRASVEMRERISLPLMREIRAYGRRHEDGAFRADMERIYRRDIQEPLKRNRALLKEDQTQAATRRPLTPTEAAALRKKIDAALLQWVVGYPDRFFRFGLYRQMEGRVNHLLTVGRAEEAVGLEAETREVCARQYRAVVVQFLEERARQFGAEARTAEAGRYRQLARHYARMADAHVRDARDLRQSRDLLCALLSRPGALHEAADHPLLRRWSPLRMASITYRSSLQDALTAAEPGRRMEAVRFLARTRSAEGLLDAATSPDEAVSSFARSRLEAAIALGDLVALQQLVACMDRLSGDRLELAHQLLLAYFRPAGTVPALRHEDPLPLAAFWRTRWQESLSPGASLTYFGDAGMRVPLNAEAGEVGDRTDRGSVPAGARSGRWTTVLRCGENTIALLTLRADSRSRAWLDGVRLDLTRDRESGRLVARLPLTPGEHVLRLDYGLAASGEADPDPRVELPLDQPDAVRLLRHQPPAPEIPTSEAGALGPLLGVVLIGGALGAGAARRRRRQHRCVEAP